MAVRRVDMNLFRVFDTIMRHRSVAGASRELKVTPSAVSHSLARLRQLLDDPLFVQSDQGMAPTQRALELAPNINEGLRRFTEAVASSKLDPERSFRTFQIAMSDYAAIVLLPLIADRLSKLAPNVNLRIFPLSRQDLVDRLDSGRVDMAVGWFANLPKRMRSLPVILESETLVARVGHALTEGTATMERLFAFPHVVVELSGSGEPTADGFIDERGVERRLWIERILLEQTNKKNGLVGRVAISLPHYSAVAHLVSKSDMIATLPRSMAIQEVAAGRLCMIDLPADYEPIKVSISTVWHERGDRDSGQQWFAENVLRPIAKLSFAAEENS